MIQGLLVAGAMTAALNYYRVNFPYFKKPTNTRAIAHLEGMYLLGETDAYISRDTGKLLQEALPKLTFKVVANSNHFLQQTAPEAVNILMREFLAKVPELAVKRSEF